MSETSSGTPEYVPTYDLTAMTPLEVRALHREINAGLDAALLGSTSLHNPDSDGPSGEWQALSLDIAQFAYRDLPKAFDIIERLASSPDSLDRDTAAAAMADLTAALDMQEVSLNHGDLNDRLLEMWEGALLDEMTRDTALERILKGAVDGRITAVRAAAILLKVVDQAPDERRMLDTRLTGGHTMRPWQPSEPSFNLPSRKS